MTIEAATRAPLAGRRIQVATAMVVAASVACGGDAVSPRLDYAYLKIAVQSAGSDLDENGYAIALDAWPAKRMAGDSLRALESFALSGGTHRILLDDVAPNCSVKGANPREVTTEVGKVSDVAFDVVCVPTAIAVTTRTTGPDSPDGLSLLVSEQPVAANESPPIRLSANGSRTVGHLKPRSYTVSLLTPRHCTVAGGSPITVNVSANTTTPLVFDVACVPATRSEKIAYVIGTVAGQSSGGTLALVNVDGTGAELLQPGNSPSWSPGRTQLAFTTTACSEGFYYAYCTGGLDVVDPETGNLAGLSRGFAFHPSWGRSGSAIAFDFGSGLGDQELAVMKLPSGSVTPIIILGLRSKERPSFSPDEKRIAFTCKAGNTDLCIVDADGLNLVRLTDDPQVDDHAAWSPDGARIAFTRYPGGVADEASAEIVVIDLATARMTTLTKGMEPSWSPDGSRLVFAGGDGLFIIGADGANRTRLTTGRHHAPAWRP